MSSLRILGCSGGIGRGLRTTSFLLNQQILIDAGTGVGDLTLDELKNINAVFLTHSHLDHVCCVPFLADSVGAARLAEGLPPLQVYGIFETITAIRDHILNNVIWPDFTKIPNQDHPFIQLNTIEIGESINLPIPHLGKITALPVRHSVPANGYVIETPTGSLAFTGDTGSCDELWEALNQVPNLKHLLIETSFNDEEESLAKISGHLSPRILMNELSKLLVKNLTIHISHLKPDGGITIIDEIQSLNKNASIFLQIEALKSEQQIYF
jgi:ribonuclease BN (tRNA processing enzyme)